MNLDKLLTHIKDKGVELSPEDVADALWLATRLIDNSGRKTSQTTSISKNELEQIPPPNISHEKQPTEAQRPPKRREFEDSYRRTSITATKTANLYVYGEGENGGKKRGYAIGVPGIPSLPQMLELERALRPLSRRKPSKRNWVIDEEATANFIASSDIWNIILRPSKERWLEAILVIEQSPTMRIWQEALREFQQLLWRTRAFCWMDTLHIDAFSPLPRLTSPTDNRQNRNPNSLINANSSRMILLCTDCLSDAWLSGKIPEWLALWEKQHPSIVLQVLPEHMWRRTSLRNAKFILGGTTLPVNAPRSFDGEPDIANQINPVPIIPLSPESLQDLSRFITAAPENQITCYKNSPLDFREIPLGLLDSSDEHFQADESSASEIFENFKETVSPITLDLARYLAIIPLFLPIMRLVQHTFVPNSQPANLAELFNSGILYRVSNSSVGENINQIEYDFLPGIRDELLSQGSKPRIRDVWEVLGNYINERFERGFDFLSILHDPTSTQEFSSGIRDESQRPFARIGAILLRRFGSEYQNAANYLEDVAEFGYSNIQNDIKESYDESEITHAEDTTKSNHPRPPKPAKSAGRSEMYLVAEKRIQEALKSGSTELSLAGMGLAAIPEQIGKLTHLKLLDLRDNYIILLPGSIGQLTNLQSLNLSNNEFKTCPEAVGQLVMLQSLDLSSNRLLHLPAVLAQLTKLVSFNLSGTTLDSIPQFIERLTQLKNLDVSQNQITDIPVFLAQLENLESLNLSNNPLNPALKSAYEQGLYAVKKYLRSLEQNAELLYEAKLVLVGEGNVGKTTLLKALKGKAGAHEPTTHGVEIDIHGLRLPHPAQDGVEIQLNAWDFGGQDVYRVTHQFFFSRRSLYLLVWEPRRGVQQGQVIDWLNMIRLRVGDDAHVIIVSTHSKTRERIVRIDKPMLMQEYGNMIVGFHEVDSLVPDEATGEMVGIAELKKVIAEHASKLEQMGMRFNRDWKAARDELLALPEPHVFFSTFSGICAAHGLSQLDADTLAHLMHDLGDIVHYSDDEKLRDDVVLKPQWLTKFIGFVLEDRKVAESEGILPDSRLYEVWHDHYFEGEPRYNPSLYPFFLRLMEKYDVSYRLLEGNASLIPYHVPQVRPELPWLPEQNPPENLRRIAMVCSMEEDPPGLVPWMIVRTHDYSVEQDKHYLHWQKGMFLSHGPHGESVLEQRGREFHIYVQATYPEYFMNVLQHTLQKLITDNWPGMEGRYIFTVPCSETINGQPCKGRFNINALRQFLAEGDTTVRCQECSTKQSITALLLGIEERPINIQLQEISQKLAGFDSRIANYFMAMMSAIAGDGKNGPRLFTFRSREARFSPSQIFSRPLDLQLWCEAEGCQHPIIEKDNGVYTIDQPYEWIKQIAPYANTVLKILSTVAPIAAPAIDLFFGSDKTKTMDIDRHLDFTNAVLGQLPVEPKGNDNAISPGEMFSEPERSGILALHRFLNEIDPTQAKLGLHRVATYTGDFRWLCKHHYDAWQPNIPDVIQ